MEIDLLNTYIFDLQCLIVCTLKQPDCLQPLLCIINLLSSSSFGWSILNIYPLIVCIATPSWFFLFTFQTDIIIVIFISFCRSLFCRNNRYHQLENTHKNFRSIVYNILLAKLRTSFQGKLCNYLFINVIYLTTVDNIGIQFGKMFYMRQKYKLYLGTCIEISRQNSIYLRYNYVCNRTYQYLC